MTVQASDDDGRVELPGGEFLMGSEDLDANIGDGEGPVRPVSVGPYGIGACTVTTAEFAAFVTATGHVTEAERFGWSFVFVKLLPGPLRKVSPRVEAAPWWAAVDGATWREPEGPGSDLAARGRHPVVHVSWSDAEAFAAWTGGRLPTEVEWEHAARGGLVQARYAWGEELTPAGEHRANLWQGRFPVRDDGDDGYRGTAPVDAFAPNGFGLHGVAGNVWEMCADAWSADGVAGRPGERVMRGGSYLCHTSYCNRYRVAARTRNTADSTSGNQGFRMAYDAAPPPPHGRVSGEPPRKGSTNSR